MRRRITALAAALVLAAAAAILVEIDTDARGLFLDEETAIAPLETPAGRAMIVAVVHRDSAVRSRIAADLVIAFEAHPMVARIAAGPQAPDRQIVEWLWRHRLVLAPPPAGAFETGAMTETFSAARADLSKLSASALADYYLRDLTGSFRRLIGHLTTAHDAALPVANGIWQSRDDSAAIVVLALGGVGFDVEAQSRLDGEIREAVITRGAKAILVGPRTISARISREISTRAQLSAAIAGTLLVLWLIVTMRSVTSLTAIFLTVGGAAAAAAIIVQMAFGAVHVIALGFGGALIGLALDYPVHLMVHGFDARQRQHAMRCVAYGALTTAIAFLALLGAGLPVLGQVGLFVASGLAMALLICFWLRHELPRIDRPRIVGRLLVSGKAIGIVPLALIGLAAVVALSAFPKDKDARIVALPGDVRADLARLDQAIGLPSGQYRIDVAGRTLGEILDRQRTLGSVLESARQSGAIGRYDMLIRYLPPAAPSAEPPAMATLRARLGTALANAGLRTDFADRALEAYARVREVDDPTPARLGTIAESPELSGLVHIEGGRIVAPVRLWDVAKPETLTAAFADLALPGVFFVDEKARIKGRMDRLSGQVLNSMMIGAGAGFLFLLLMLRGRRSTAEIGLTCLAGALVSAAFTAAVFGGLGIFQIAALTLVIGIGIDYGLFLRLAADGGGLQEATISVALCATTTMIAFFTMALSGVGILEEIGTTVVIGIAAMLALNGMRPGRPAVCR